MTSGRKIAVSLLISVSLFAAFVVVAYSGLFSVIDTRFYEPEKVSQIQKNLDLISQSYQEYIETLESRFGKNPNSFLKQDCTRYYFENEPDDEFVRQRQKLQGDLFSQTPGLLGMRLIDKNGSQIHFSTFNLDQLNRTDKIVAYKNYSDIITAIGEKEIPFNKIEASDSYGTKGNECRSIFDGRDNRIIITFPYYDNSRIYRGTFVFYVDGKDVNRVLLSKKLITFSDNGKIVSELNFDEDKNSLDYKSGFVFGIPSVGKKIFEDEILLHWKKGLVQPEKIVYNQDEDLFVEKKNDASILESKKENNYWILVSSKPTPYGFVGGIYSGDFFLMPDEAKILLLVCIFVSLLLVIFLLVNIKRDDMLVIRERIRKLQLGIINDYLKKKENVNWKIVSGQIADRRQDVTAEILKSLGRKAKKHDKEINELINKSWDELLSAMNVQVKSEELKNENLNVAEIKKMLEELLSSGSIKVQAVAQPGQNELLQKSSTVVENSTLDNQNNDLEEVEELEDVENVETLQDVEDLEEAEPVEDLEEIDELDEVEELEDAESVENPQDVEELEEAEPVEDLEEIEELDEVDEVADLETIPESDSIQLNNDGESQNVDIDEFNGVVVSGNHEPEAEITSSDDVEIINKKAQEFHSLQNACENEIVDNFKIFNPNFIGLDSFENDDNSKEKNKESETLEKTEEVSLDDFNVSFEEKHKVSKADLAEVIDFGSVENKQSNNSADAVKFDIEPTVPNFNMLDEKIQIKHNKHNAKSSKKFSVKNIMNQVQTENNIDDAEELDAVDVDIPFSLTQFGAATAKPVELKPYVNVIHEDESGIYVIKTDGAETPPTNLEFKNLVDSVLKR